MTRHAFEALGQLQRDVLEALWTLGEATVHEVRDKLPGEKDLAYTTVLSTLQKLEKAGWVTHRSEGRMHVYRAQRSREEEGARTMRQVLGPVFGGNPLALFRQLVQDPNLKKEDLAELRKLIDKRRKELNDE